MNDHSKLELLRVRLRFVDLIKSFFTDEPDSEKMSRWRGTFSALAREQVSPQFDQAAVQMAEALFTFSLNELQEEYYTLFVDPIEGEQVDLTASIQLNGRAYSQSLVNIRGLMAEAGLQRKTGVREPEDSLVVLLDSLASLIEEEKDGEVTGIQLFQQRLLEEFLLPLAEKLQHIFQQNSKAQFYTLCSTILCSYLDLEKDLISGR